VTLPPSRSPATVACWWVGPVAFKIVGRPALPVTPGSRLPEILHASFVPYGMIGLVGHYVEGSSVMESSARVLVVAHKTAATPALIEAVRQRAGRGGATFTLLVPNAVHGMHKVVDPQDVDVSEAQAVLDLALPLLSEAAGSEVEGMVGDPDPLAAVQDAINIHGFDEVIISTLSGRVSRWLKLDLPSKVSGLGLPVTTVTAGEGIPANA